MAGLKGAVAWLAPATLACLLLIGFGIETTPGLSGDSIALVHGAHTISHCIAHGVLAGCDHQASWTGFEGVSTDVYHGVIEGDVGPYPIFQYVPALILEHLGFGDFSVFRGLELISTVSVCVVVVFAALLAAQTGRRWAPALVVLLVTTSPLLFYAGQTFGEGLAAALVMLSLGACLRRWPALVVGLFAFSACVTKETAPPLVALLGFAALLATPIAASPLRRGHWVGLAGGVIAGAAANVLFNVFRYDQLSNFTYGHSYDRVPGLIRKLEFAGDVWIAPNGGLVMFWLVAGLLVLALIVFTARASGLRDRLPGLALIAALLVLTGVLADWYSPFGWQAWGPRLMLPVLPSVTLAIVILTLDRLEPVLRWVFGSALRIGIGAMSLVVLALPEINVLHAPDVVGSIFTPDEVCPTSPSVIDTQYYYHCIAHQAWGRHWLPLASYRALAHPWGVAFAVSFAVIWLALLLAIGRALGIVYGAHVRVGFGS